MFNEEDKDKSIRDLLEDIDNLEKFQDSKEKLEIIMLLNNFLIE